MSEALQSNTRKPDLKLDTDLRRLTGLLSINGSNEVDALIGNVFPRIQALIDDGSRETSDYTLHGSGTAFPKKMMEIFLGKKERVALHPKEGDILLTMEKRRSRLKAWLSEIPEDASKRKKRPFDRRRGATKSGGPLPYGRTP